MEDLYAKNDFHGPNHTYNQVLHSDAPTESSANYTKGCFLSKEKKTDS